MSDSDSTVPDGFRVIPGYPRYAINETGTVLSVCGRGGSVRTNRPWSDAKHCKQSTNTGGYQFVTLRHDGRARPMPIHKLVLTTFVGPCPDGMECRHLDGNKVNNHVLNLAWGTAKQNGADKALHGTASRNKAKLTANDVLAIRARAASGESQRSIAKDFPMTQKGISLIVQRRTWKHT